MGPYFGINLFKYPLIISFKLKRKNVWNGSYANVIKLTFFPFVICGNPFHFIKFCVVASMIFQVTGLARSGNYLVSHN